MALIYGQKECNWEILNRPENNLEQQGIRKEQRPGFYPLQSCDWYRARHIHKGNQKYGQVDDGAGHGNI